MTDQAVGKTPLFSSCLLPLILSKTFLLTSLYFIEDCNDIKDRGYEGRDGERKRVELVPCRCHHVYHQVTMMILGA